MEKSTKVIKMKKQGKYDNLRVIHIIITYLYTEKNSYPQKNRKISNFVYFVLIVDIYVYNSKLIK